VNQIFLRAKDGEVPKPIDFSVRCDDFKITYYDLPGKEEKHVKNIPVSSRFLKMEKRF